jgi:DNA-binding transcriptional LysR family regulator
MIDRYLLRYFQAVIDEGNFSRAAARCNVSQPTLSAGIAKLERSLERTLFRRTNRRVELTAAGATFAVHARRIEAEFASAIDALRGAEDGILIRLGILSTIPDQKVGNAVAELLQCRPGLRIELVEGREADLTERLARGRIDVAFTILRSGTSRFNAMPLVTEGYSLAVASGHPLAAATVVDAAELAQTPMIVRRACELLSETSRHFTGRGVRPFFVARTQSDARALELVRAGLGVTVMPDSYESIGVVRPALADFKFERTIGLIHGTERGVEPLARTQAYAQLAASITRVFNQVR